MDDLAQHAGSLGLSDGAAQMEPKKRFNAAASQSFLPTSPAATKNFKSARPSNLGKFGGMNSPNFSDIPSFVPSTSKQVDNEEPGSPTKTQISPPRQNPYLVSSNAPTLNPYAQQSMEHLPQMNNFTAAQPEFIYPPQPASNFPLNYHLYAPSSSQHLHLKGNEQNVDTLFIPSKLRESLTKKNQATLQTMAHSNLPPLIGVYFNLVPLNRNLDRSTVTYGYYNSLYKATSNTNGRAYALRRIENVNIDKDRSISTIHLWIKLRHSNVGQVVDAFTTRSFGDNSLIIVYDFYPGAQSLYEQHIFTGMGSPEPLTTELLWSYMCQIATGIAAIHTKKLAVRSLSLKKVIVTSKNRVRLSDCGVLDILNYSELYDSNELASLQELDLSMFGDVMLKLTERCIVKDKQLRMNEYELLNHHDLDKSYKKALSYLLDTSSPHSIEDFQILISSRVFKEFDRIQNTADYYESQLSRELENSRLVRLTAKINFLIDRPEYEQNKLWGQTGERYPVKLFFQHLYQQTNPEGKPVLDLAHVLINLNKLDAGIEERIMLVSPDEKRCLIVSYKEIKDLIEKSFRELTKESL